MIARKYIATYRFVLLYVVKIGLGAAGSAFLLLITCAISGCGSAYRMSGTIVEIRAAGGLEADKYRPLANSVVWIPSRNAVARHAKEVEISSDNNTLTPLISAMDIDYNLRFVNNDSLPWVPKISPVYNIYKAAPDDHGTHCEEAIRINDSVEMCYARMVKIGCDVVATRRAYLWTFSRASFSITDSNGTFHLSSLPKTPCEIYVWNEKYGLRSMSLKVQMSRECTVILDKIPNQDRIEFHNSFRQ